MNCVVFVTGCRVLFQIIELDCYSF